VQIHSGKNLRHVLMAAVAVCLLGLAASFASGLPTAPQDRKPAASGKGKQVREASRPQAATPRSATTPGLSATQQDKKPARVHPRSAGRHKRGGKAQARATLHAKPDLSHHGLLHQPRRYDPTPRHRGTGGAPNPQTGEVLHDHFLELDKNRDGLIDPFEQVTGRLDIDRDLANHRWQ
jgi:hypothetical protein